MPIRPTPPPLPLRRLAPSPPPADGRPVRFAVRAPGRHRVAIAFVAVLCAASASGLRAATSDRLVVLGDDGRPRLVEHVLASDGALLRFELPAGAGAAAVRFAGPERAIFAAAERRSPGRVALWSGSAVLRYRERRDTPPDTDATGAYRLRVPSVPAGLVVEDGELERSSRSWLLPEGAEIVSFGGGSAGSVWSASGALLTHEQRGGGSSALEIVWRRRDERADGERRTATSVPPDPCENANADRTLANDRRSDGCAPGEDADAEAVSGVVAETGAKTGTGTGTEVDADADADADADGVPDHRDVCLSGRGRDESPAEPVDRFGCPSAASGGGALVLDGIVFPPGKGYLDLAARGVLDRVARALLVDDDGVYEIAAHTDGAGSRAHNLRLSERRAQAVRHYLMLRGVSPNRLRARGHGEANPRADDATAAGRRANRRIELERVADR